MKSRVAPLNSCNLRIAFYLFLSLTCLYTLTARGFITIADEETLFGVTATLVDRGTFAQPASEDIEVRRVVVRGRDGQNYAITGPLQSLLAIPYYLLGKWIAQAFPPPFYGYFTRMFVSFFNAPVQAAMTALVYLLALDIGYRRRTALFLALSLALSTVVWPYARTFYAESLLTLWLVVATWAVLRYARGASWHWMSLTGVALALGTATKYVTGVAGPIVAIYLLIHFIQKWRRAPPAAWRWLCKTILAGGLPFLLLIGLLLYFNYLRFGSLLQTGYTLESTRGTLDTWSTTATPLISWYGFFFSAGKGFFFYSPPILLALLGIMPLIKRRPTTSFLLLALALSYPLFYSLITWAWYGGGNWGPRYLVCITPFLLLPLGDFIERRDIACWIRVGCASAFFIIGFWVQTSHLFINYATYLFSDVPSAHQRFYPEDSPLVAQWERWPGNLRGWRAYDHAYRVVDAHFYALAGALYPIEVPTMAPCGRWIGDRLHIYLYAQPQEELMVRLSYSRPHTADTSGDKTHIIYDGVAMATEREKITQNEHETQWIETITIPADDVHVWPGTLTLTTTTWSPPEELRELGVFLSGMEVMSDGKLLPYYDVQLPNPLPISAAYRWSQQARFWFYNPENFRPLDIWPWYVWTSGVPLPQARRLIYGLMVIFSCGFAISGYNFVKLLHLRHDEARR